MPEKTLANDHQSDKDTGSTANVSTGAPARKNRGVTFLLIVGVAVIAAFAGYYYRLLGPFVNAPPTAAKDEELATAFARLSPENFISESKIFAELGKSPADPSRVLFPSFEKSVASDGEKIGKSCPPAGVPPTAQEALPGATTSPLHEAPPLGASGAPAVTGKPVGTPVIASRAPEDSAPQEKSGRKKKGSEPKTQDAEKAKEGEDRPVEGSAKQSEPPDQPKVPVVPARDKPLQASALAPKARDTADQGKSEQFQMPGSLVVKISGYAGTMSKWGLLVVLDDSDAMARKTKTWQPNRVQAGADFVGKLSQALPPNSRLAVRDFMCSKAQGAKKQPAAPCPTHMLYDWADTPFKGLKDKLQSLQPGGVTDPCAAAAFALRKDLAGVSKVTPRLLIITSGAGKCSVKELLHALDNKTPLDVLALGMPKKKQASYAAIARKGSGVFLKAEKPADLEQVLERYGKTLKTKAREKIEIRSDKAVFSSALDEELTLPPGSYTVTLPPVTGLEASRRVIPNVKVGSGEAKVLEVPLKKPRPAARTGKKGSPDR